ncbi:MAG: hypothetical protein JNM18_12355 [Planctomycetaceae bacterium]|nr:hypothetical protein [Planctomycetaceae bacterium]
MNSADNSNRCSNPYAPPVENPDSPSSLWERLCRATVALGEFFGIPRGDVRCSFCRRPYREAKPFAEGPRGVFICGQCATGCVELIERERERLDHARKPDAT